MASQEKYKLSGAAVGPVDFGSFLRRQREARELPLRAVAAAVGMDQAHLSKAELGQRLPTTAQTVALALFFRQDPVDWEARRITQKFLVDHGGNPAAARALRMLQGGREANPVQSQAPDGESAAPTESSGVIVMHVD